jgi:hypothetical protein
MNRIQRDGLCLDSKTGEHKLILSILLILSELCLDSEAGDPDSQKETKITETENRVSVRWLLLLILPCLAFFAWFAVNSPFKSWLETVAAVCDRRISPETNASALTERRYKPLSERAVKRHFPKAPRVDSGIGAKA